ncbi:MAG TPA: hypothetical protein VME21_04945 [Steroidobacteraceae bacterium]|nr:hypothetical protein [Steroidobacteraceae bacterium]
MRFRLKAFGFHLLGSVTMLTLVMGVLYLGWYHWPGWYLTGMPTLALVVISVDVVLGPLVTLLIASPAKRARTLAGDIAVIVAVQLCALAYGAHTLWGGRPLYYAFSEDRVEAVQAQDLDAKEIALARTQNPGFTPHWYSLPRWVWAPLPKDDKTSRQIIASAISGGNDVVDMPRYFKDWAQGSSTLRERLKPLDKLTDFTGLERQSLREQLTKLGLDPTRPDYLLMTGRTRPVLLVMDHQSLRIREWLRAHPRIPPPHYGKHRRHKPGWTERFPWLETWVERIRSVFS